MLFSNNISLVSNDTEWKETTEALYKHLRRDSSDITEMLRTQFPKTYYQRRQLAVVPFVWRVARELAGLYRKPPTRRMIGQGLTEEVQTRINSIYKSIDADTQMEAALEMLVALNNASIWVWPTTFGGVRLLVIPPHHQEWIMADPLSTDTRDAEFCRIKLPLAVDPDSGLMTWGIAKISASESVWEKGPQAVIGKNCFTGEADPTNPIGRIPAVVVRGGNPDISSGEFWAPANSDLLHAARTISLTYIDLLFISSQQGFGQPVVTGIGPMAEELELGPESVISLPDGEATFSFEHGNPPLAEYREVAESYLNSCIAMLGLRPDMFLKTAGAVSAVAKEMDYLDRDIERSRHKVKFEAAEQQVYDLTRAWINRLRASGRDAYPEATVKILFHDPQRKIDPLHYAQSVALQMDRGMTSASVELAKLEGIPISEAKRKSKEYLAETMAIKRITNPDERLTQGRDTNLEVVSGD